MPEEFRLSLSAAGLVKDGGKFEIMAITVGDANGWTFSEDCLRASLELWEGVECFVDHGGWFGGRSVRDLGGVCNEPRWTEDVQGIKLDLKTMGPSGELVSELGRQILAEEEPPKVGFSADILFTAKGKEVKDILRVLDLSLVFDPARGGAFVRAMNQLHPEAPINEPLGKIRDKAIQETKEAIKMEEKVKYETGTTAAEQIQEDAAAIQALQEQQADQEKLANEAEESRKVRIQMCAYLLESGLNASHLPEAMKDHVRKQFEGQVFSPEELNEAIESSRSVVSELKGSEAIQGPRLSGMFSSEDQLQAAVDDLLDAPRD
ncbi:MAG: hypothetical protein JJE12_15875, partial [Anaerolineales bacterium]|nr:hypothetical protein [Anaerolineales bacterium]